MSSLSPVAERVSLLAGLACCLFARHLPMASCVAMTMAALLLLPVAPAQAALIYTSAVKDLTCAGFRAGGKLTCTAGEFTVSPVFSAEPGTPPFCTAGAEFNFKVDLGLSGTNTDRYDIGFFVGQQGNDPRDTTAGNICSVATFPVATVPVSSWEDDNSNTCGDYNGGGSDTTRIDEIKVVCSGDATGALTIPYVLTYWQNSGGTCNNATDVNNGAPSKCNSGTSPVSGVVAVSAGAYVDITKQTLPDGHSQSFSFTATGPAGSKVSVLTGATLTPTSATGGTYTPATISAATNSTTFTLSDGQTARIYINALSTAQTLSIVEAATGGWNSTAAISCAPVTGAPTLITNGATRTVTAALSQSNSAAACTITNTKPPTVTVTKVSTGDVGTFTVTGSNGWVSQNLTTVTSGVGVSGATQTLTPSVATELVESVAAGYRLASISCTGMGAGGTATNDLANRKVILDAAAMAPGSNIACTFSNIRQRTLTVTKSLLPGADTGLFVMNANGTTGTEAGNGATASALVDVASTATFGEAAGTATALANYASTYSCNTTPVTSGSGSSGSFTMPNANVGCTITNTRKAATLTLRKTWANAISGNTATVTSTGLTNNATSGASVSSGNNTTTGSAVTVYAGEAGTLAESFSVGSAGNYAPSLACTGSSGLSGSTLTVAPADTAIVCTLTNTRKSATLQLAKTWSGAFAGDTATVTSSGFTNNATSGVVVSTGNNTITGTPVTVYAAEVGSLSESLSVGDPANYVASLACTGSSGLSGSTLTVAPADTTILCTYTNTKKQPSLSLLKWSTLISDPVNGSSNPKSIPGSILNYSLRLTNSGPGTVDNNSLIISDPLPTTVELYVGDLAGAGLGPVLFVDGVPVSSLGWTFTSLASLTDSVDFSNDNGVTWTYVPVPDGNGFDSAVTHLRLRPQGTMSAAGGGNPYVEMTFRVRLK